MELPLPMTTRIGVRHSDPYETSADRQDQPIGTVPSWHVQVLVLLLIPGLWRLGPLSSHNGLAQVTATLYGLLSTWVSRILSCVSFRLINRSHHRVHGEMSRG
jgi:hypothetical protein